MNAQELCNHLISLQEQIKLDVFTFTQPNGREFVLEAIYEFWDWYFCQDNEGKWYYKDKSGSTQVTVEHEDGDDREEEGGGEGVVKKDIEEDYGT